MTCAKDSFGAAVVFIALGVVGSQNPPQNSVSMRVELTPHRSTVIDLYSPSHSISVPKNTSVPPPVQACCITDCSGPQSPVQLLFTSMLAQCHAPASRCATFS